MEANQPRPFRMDLQLFATQPRCRRTGWDRSATVVAKLPRLKAAIVIRRVEILAELALRWRPTRPLRSGCGRCHRRGRTERAHRGLEISLKNARFPQRPQPFSFLQKNKDEEDYNDGGPDSAETGDAAVREGVFDVVGSSGR
jgi:hypothetical protein